MGFLVGYRFMEHGVAKVLRGPDVFAGILQQLRLPLPQVAAWLTISTEILGGLAVLLGALVSWASIPLAAVKLLYFRFRRQLWTCRLRSRCCVSHCARDADPPRPWTVSD
jgi:uncharacterized membrane protein YphA (DoxX/SURF4 family)